MQKSLVAEIPGTFWLVFGGCGRQSPSVSRWRCSPDFFSAHQHVGQSHTVDRAGVVRRRQGLASALVVLACAASGRPCLEI